MIKFISTTFKKKVPCIEKYIVRLFKPGEHRVEFYQHNRDSLLVAACTLRHVDTVGTLLKTINVLPTSAKSFLNKSISAKEPLISFSVLGNLSSGIRFILASKFPLDKATLNVCLLNGRNVASVQLKPISSGTHSIHWNPVNESGKKLSPGNYLLFWSAAQAAYNFSGSFILLFMPDILYFDKIVIDRRVF